MFCRCIRVEKKPYWYEESQMYDTVACDINGTNSSKRRNCVCSSEICEHDIDECHLQVI